MKVEKFKVLLYLKKSGLDKSGKAPIMGRITVNRTMAQFSCKLSCNPELWNPRESRLNGKSKEAVEVNAKIDKLLLGINSAFDSLLARKIDFDATAIKELFQGSVETQMTLLKRLDMHIEDMRSRVGIDVAKTSLSTYVYCRRYLGEYIQKRFKTDDVAFGQMNEQMAFEYQEYALNDKGLAVDTVRHYLAILKKICRMANGTVDPLPQKLQPIAEGVTRLISSIFDPKALDDMVVEEKTTTPDNKLNENFDRAEFQALWNEINHQYVYTVSYDSNELIDKAILHINAELEVKQLRYVMMEGTQDENQVVEFGNTRSQSRELTDVCTSTVKYDLVGDIAKGTNLTRRTVVKVLQGIKESKLYLFKNNPEEFIRKVISIIKEQKSTMIVEAIHYNMTEGKYDSDIFTVKSKMDFDRAYEAKKHITDYVFSDSKAERQFAHDLDEASEVVVYAKLPRTFQIPTPVGNYAPDWAIAMKKNDVKHIFFIAETKGSMSSMDLSAIEKAKINCAEKLFNSISTANVKYHKVATYQDLIDGMNAIG